MIISHFTTLLFQTNDVLQASSRNIANKKVNINIEKKCNKKNEWLVIVTMKLEGSLHEKTKVEKKAICI